MTTTPVYTNNLTVPRRGQRTLPAPNKPYDSRSTAAGAVEHVPMTVLGRLSSLNVSAAAALATYEVTRHRTG